MYFGKNETTALLHFKHTQVGDDEVDDSQARDGQRAFLYNFRAAVLRGVLHHRHHALHAGDEIHRAARPFDHLAWDHPIRDVAGVRHFESAENGKIDVAAANLPE